MKKVVRFFLEAKAELTKVNWPSQQELIRYTLLVVAISFAVAVFLGLLDVSFSYVVENYLINQ